MLNQLAPNNNWASAFFDPATLAEDSVVASASDSLPRFTDHTYHDFSTYIKNGGRIEKHKKCDRNFPARLHAILADDQFSHIIAWMPHGRAWKVLNKKLLMEEVVPEYFGQSKYASFTRQLSGWGFKRLHQTGRDFGCYYHECFLQGHPKLTVLMRRTSPGKGKSTRNVHAEPDFYLIAEQYPLHPTVVEKSASLSKSGDKKTKGESRSREQIVSQQVSPTSFDPIPVPTRDNVRQPHAMTSNYRQGQMGPPQMFRHQESFQYQSQPPRSVAAICREDGPCANDSTLSCHWGNHHYQYAAGHYSYPSRDMQRSFQDPMMLNRGSISQGYYGSQNMYSQYPRSHEIYQQASAQGQDHSPYRRSSSATTTQNGFPPESKDTTSTEDSLKEMPMSIPEKGFDFNITSIEDSFYNSPVDQTTAFLS